MAHGFGSAAERRTSQTAPDRPRACCDRGRPQKRLVKHPIRVYVSGQDLLISRVGLYRSAIYISFFNLAGSVGRARLRADLARFRDIGRRATSNKCKMRLQSWKEDVQEMYTHTGFFTGRPRGRSRGRTVRGSILGPPAAGAKKRSRRAAPKRPPPANPWAVFDDPGRSGRVGTSY